MQTRSTTYNQHIDSTLAIYWLIDLLKAYSPVDRTGAPQGFSQVQISHKLNTIKCVSLFIEGLPHMVTPELFTSSKLAQVEYNTNHVHYINVKHKHNPKVRPFGIALVKNGK